MTAKLKDAPNENILDEIIDDDFFQEVSNKNDGKIVSEVIVANPKAISQDQKIEDIPSLRGEGYPSDYTAMVDRIQWQYKMLPLLNFDAIYSEIADLSVKACPTPTLQVLNDEIQKVQGAKDRLSEIFIDILKSYNFKKRAVDILQDAWGKFTAEKNADGRKGDAAFRLSNFMLDFASTEGLLKACMHVLKNLDSLHDSLSRRITIYQLTMKLHDVGRTALPDYDFDRVVDKPDEEISAIFGDPTEGNASNEDDLPPLKTF
jgi:hypothetical protein